MRPAVRNLALLLIFSAISAGQLKADSLQSIQYTTSGTVTGFPLSGGGVCNDCNQGLSSVTGINLPQFDPAIGTLESVLFEVSIQMSGTALNNGNVLLSLQPFAGSPTFGEFSFMDYEVSLDAQQSNFSHSFSASLFFPVDLEPFIGMGAVSFGVFDSISVDQSDGGEYEIGDDPSPFSASATYIYVPAVPEPPLWPETTLALLLLMWRTRQTEPHGGQHSGERF